MQGFYFFTSFSEFGNRTLVQRFHDDLERRIGEMVGGRNAPKGYIDQEMDPGVPWRSKLIDAACEVPAMVALLSVDYFHSPWCRSEWETMCHREKLHTAKLPLEHAKSAPPCLVPLVWYRPAENITWPDWVTERQYLRGERFGDVYDEAGLAALMRRDLASPHYDDLLSHVAKRVISAYEFRLSPLERSRAEQLFAPPAETGPVRSRTPGTPAAPRTDADEDDDADRGRAVVDADRASASVVAAPSTAVLPRPKVGFIVAAAANSEQPEARTDRRAYRTHALSWSPFLAQAHESAVDIAFHATRTPPNPASQMSYTLIPDFADMLAEARDEGRVMVFLLDPWLVCLPNYKALLAEYDRLDHSTAGLVAVLSNDDHESMLHARELGHGMVRTLQRKHRQRFDRRYVWGAEQPEELATSVRQVVDHLHRILRDEDDSVRRESPFLRVSVAGQPKLRGPFGGAGGRS